MQNTQSNMPLVSFIVPCYNVPIEYVRECLDSIFSLALSKDEREIILIDDGSEECPLPALSDVRDDIIYIRQKNKGLGAARNVGIELCKGKYIQFVDSDDKLLTIQYNHCIDIVRFHDPDMVLFKQSNKEEKPDSASIALPEPIDGGTYMRHNNLRASVCGYIFKKKNLLNHRFTENILHEDEEFTPLLILRCEKIYDIDATAYFYRKRDDSITTSKSPRQVLKRLDDTEQVIINLQHTIPSLAMMDGNAMRRRVDQLTMDYLYNTIVLTRSSKELEKRIARLQYHELFPLKQNDYTKKYKIFTKMINSKVGRQILLRTIPLIKR